MSTDATGPLSRSLAALRNKLADAIGRYLGLFPHQHAPLYQCNECWSVIDQPEYGSREAWREKHRLPDDGEGDSAIDLCPVCGMAYCIERLDPGQTPLVVLSQGGYERVVRAGDL